MRIAVAILPASIDLDKIAARLKCDDPEASAALEELGTAEWIVGDAQEILVTAAAFAAAADIRGSVAAPAAVEILNSSFERPSTRSVDCVTTDDWVSGGTWFGRWTAPVWARKDRPPCG